MPMLPMRIAKLAALIAAALPLIATPLRAQPAGGGLPPGPGRDLLTAACTQCHGLATIMAMRDGPGGWRAQVSNMVVRGAQLSGPEMDQVVQYLVTNFGPGSQQATPAAPVALPAGSGKELVETRCGLCHDLNRVVAIRRPKSGWDDVVANMIRRGAPATPEEGQTIAAYLAAQFGGN
jgi:mono/diheme cytochrome c family protein